MTPGNWELPQGRAAQRTAGSQQRVVRPLRGLEKVCKLYGRMKCGATMMVWDYANEVAVPESEMPPGSKRRSMSEKAKRSNTKLTDAGE